MRTYLYYREKSDNIIDQSLISDYERRLRQSRSKKKNQTTKQGHHKVLHDNWDNNSTSASRRVLTSESHSTQCSVLKGKNINNGPTTIKSKKKQRTKSPNILAFEEILRPSVGSRITVVNDVDTEGVPEGYQFSQKYIYGPNVREPDTNFLVGCNCAPGTCHENHSCSCLAYNDGKSYYTSTGKLAVGYDKIIYECNVNCN